MGKALMLIGGIGLGAGLSYLLDPEEGQRRRAWLREQTAGQLLSRARSFLAEGHLLERMGDSLLARRARGRAAQTTTHPELIQVSARDGRVTLAGPVLSGELEDLMGAVSSLRGVIGVDNQLQVHEREESLPLAGQATGSEPTPTADLFGAGGRMACCAAGGGLLVFGIARRGLLGAMLGALGAGLLVKGLGQERIMAMIGLDRGPAISETADGEARVGAGQPAGEQPAGEGPAGEGPAGEQPAGAQGEEKQQTGPRGPRPPRPGGLRRGGRQHGEAAQRPRPGHPHNKNN